jgi:alpha-tubulin suppressor-like RCC1 family protein
MPRRLLALLLLSLAVPACLPPIKTGCRTSADCSKGRSCVSGTCQDDRFDGGRDDAPVSETPTDLRPRWDDLGGPDRQPELPASDVAGKVEVEVSLPDAAPACPGPLGCAFAADLPPEAGTDSTPTGNAGAEPIDAPADAVDARGMLADASDGAADAPADLNDASDGRMDVLADLADASDGPLDIPVDLVDASDGRVDVPADLADASDGPPDAPVDLTDAPDAPADVGVLPTDADQAETGLDGGARPCTTNEECASPQVCNINLDGTCGAPVYTHVDVADENTCAVVSDGTVRCWGGNTWGQLGPEVGTIRALPFPVPDQRDVRMVATGWSYTCTLHRTGQVDCWGMDWNGQLGCDSPADSSNGLLCTPYPAGSPIEQLVVGAARACVRKRGGTVECWGANDHYDLGDGTNVSGPDPKPVYGISDATAIATGVWQGCAVLASGGLKCWGPNDRGQLGNGTLDTIPVPTTVFGMDGVGAKVVAVSPAEDHSCALLDDGSVRCFGENSYGELGDGQTVAYSTTPVPCAFSRPASLIASGIHFTCAALSDGKVECLGRGDFGQLGNGGDSHSLTPVAASLPGGTVLESIATKYSHVCALDQQGRVWCWGANQSGQLGNGATSELSAPVLVRAPGEN